MIFGLSYLRLFIVGAILAAAGLIGVKIYNAGVADERAKWVALIEKERADQKKAIRDAGEEAWRVIDRLNSELEERNATIDSLNDEGDADPDAGSGGITADSVRRINRGRAP